MVDGQGEVTRLLRAWSTGDAAAGNALLPLIYAELGRIARSQRRHAVGAVTLQTTEIVHEAWVRLRGQSATDWQSRAHFFALAATMARRVLVDHARYRSAQRRDRSLDIPLDAGHEMLSDQQAEEILGVHQALEELEQLAPRQAALVELRYFAGLGLEEIASVQEVSLATVKRDWTLARAWLFRRLSDDHRAAVAGSLT